MKWWHQAFSVVHAFSERSRESIIKIRVHIYFMSHLYFLEKSWDTEWKFLRPVMHVALNLQHNDSIHFADKEIRTHQISIIKSKIILESRRL